MKVIDASVLATFVNKEPLWEKVKELLEENICIAPPLIIDEVLNTIWKRYYRGMLSYDDALKLCNVFIKNIPVKIISLDEDMWKIAFKIAVENKITIYDAEYVALSLIKNAPLITRDKKLLAVGKYLKIHVEELR